MSAGGKRFAHEFGSNGWQQCACADCAQKRLELSREVRALAARLFAYTRADRGPTPDDTCLFDARRAWKEAEQFYSVGLESDGVRQHLRELANDRPAKSKVLDRRTKHGETERDDE